MESSYEQLVKALRIHTSADIECDECAYYDDCYIHGPGEKMIADAAAAIEALETEIRESMQKCAECGDANMPKLGEWQKAKQKGVVTYSDGYAECSHCHEAIWLGWGMNFCPNCGTQNKIIDPDDYDGAKMEVQDGQD